MSLGIGFLLDREDEPTPSNWFSENLVPDNVELAWAAGFFDGEGCSSACQSGKGRYLKLSLAQKEKQPVDRFERAIGGGIRFQNEGMYWWSANGYQAERLMAKILPFLSEPKRRQYEKVLQQITPRKRIFTHGYKRNK